MAQIPYLDVQKLSKRSTKFLSLLQKDNMLD